MDSWRPNSTLPKRAHPPPADSVLCRGGFFNSGRRPSPCLITGLLLGILIISISHLVGYLPHGKSLNDPIYLALSFGVVTRGFLYFNWAGLLITAGAFSSFGFSAWLGLNIAARKKKRINADDVRRVVNLGIIIGITPVLVGRIDSIMLLFWYGIASVLGLFLADFIGRLTLRTAHYFN